MSKRLIIVLALVFVVGLCATTYAAVQNVKVSGDIDMKGVVRNSIALQDNPTGVSATTTGYGESISAILSTVRLRVDADLTDNVSTTVRLLNERAWGEESAASTDIDLDLAYVTLKEFLYSPMTLTLGRQELRFGNGLIIGDPDTNGIAAGHGVAAVALPDSLDDLSSRKAFDAARVTLNYDPLTVDLIYSKIDEGLVQQADDIDLWGVNTNYVVNKNIDTELYYFARKRDRFADAGADMPRSETIHTIGTRGVYTGIKNLTLGLEGAMQVGNHVVDTTLYPDDLVVATGPWSRRVQAYAIQAIANYVFPKAKYSPSVIATYTRLSGDKYQSRSDNYRGWNPMFEDQAGGTLYNKILGYSNAELFALSGTMKPMGDVTAALAYSYIKLVYSYPADATAVHLSGVAGDPHFAMRDGKKSLGHEVDLKLTYDYTEDVQFALNTGAFIPGEAFDSKNKKTASQVIGSMKVTF